MEPDYGPSLNGLLGASGREPGAATALRGLLCRQHSYREIRARLLEARRTVAPGGLLCILEPNPLNPFVRAWMRSQGIRPDGFAKDRFPSGLRAGQVHALLLRSGWVPAERSGWMFGHVHAHAATPAPPLPG